MQQATSELVPAEKYPPLLAPAARRKAAALLKSRDTLARAGRIIAMKAAEFHGAVLELAAALDAAAERGDWPAAFAATHEIRGLAATAGLAATGRIANVFCHYLDALARHGLEPETAVVALHVEALQRSARTRDEAARHGDAVAQQLMRLVARKLADVKVSATA